MGTYAGAAAQDSDRMAADRAWVRWGMAAAVPTIMFTVTGVLGLRQAGLFPPWVPALGWLPAAAHVLVLFTLAQRGPFAADGIIAGLVPLTTVIWILALAATLPRSRRAAVLATSGTGG